jgi:hypothetical protein
MVIVDTSVIIAAYVADEPRHRIVTGALAAASRPLIVSPYVVAETDHLLATRHGVRTELAVLRDLIGGAWDLVSFDPADLAAAIDVVERYADHNVGITDASMVVLANRYRTHTVATLDRRHFSVLRPLDGGHFTIVP